MFYDIGKRLLDIFLSVFILLLVIPVMFLLGLVIYLKMGSPVLFWHERPGKNSKVFKLCKFRTMSEEKGEDGSYLADEMRITPFGLFLRKTSLDELPQLLNIVKGDMSFVGPRPLLVEYLERYSPAQARRHEVLPGLTGWAQVNGRNAITWEEKFEFDTWYVDNRSFTLDMKIIFLTIIKLIGREGISQPGHVTAEPFKGSEKK